MKSELERSGWEKTKIAVRVWIERTRGDADSSLAARAVAKLIWSVHSGRSSLKNFPRLLRIRLRILLGPIRAFDRQANDPSSEVRAGLVDRRNLDSELDRIASLAPVDSVDPARRDGLANAMAKTVSQHLVPLYAPNAPREVLLRLEEDGIVEIPQLRLNAEAVREIRQHLERQPVYAAHVATFSDGIPRQLSDPQSRISPFGSYKIDQAVATPRLLELAVDPLLLALAESYLGCVPTIYSLHAWWSFPGHRNSGPQVYHRDPDDHRFLAFFVYLTDVDGGPAGGEHEFATRTHRLSTMETYFPRDPRLADEFFPPRALGTVSDEAPLYRELFGDGIKAITGKAGSVFLADTYGLHRGVPPTQTPRLVCWIRFGLRKAPTYDMNGNHAVQFDWKSGRLPDDDYHRYVTRFLLKSEN